MRGVSLGGPADPFTSLSAAQTTRHMRHSPDPPSSLTCPQAPPEQQLDTLPAMSACPAGPPKPERILHLNMKQQLFVSLVIFVKTTA